MVVNGWLKGVSGIILLASAKWPKTFVFVVFRGIFGTKKAALAALSIIGYNWVIPTGIPNYSKIMVNSRRLYFSFFIATS